MKRIITAPLLLSALLLMWSCSSSDDEVLGVNSEIPQFTLAEGYYHDGTEAPALSSAQFTGKKGIIAFITSYCSDCTTQMYKIVDMWKRFGEDPGVKMAVISRQGGPETPEAIAAYWASAKFPMPYYIDYDRKVYDLFAKSEVPRVYLIDSSGKVRHIFHTNLDPSTEEFAELVNAME